MFVLFLLHVVQSIKLTEFENFLVNLEANVTEYFLFQGNIDYAYFYQKNKNFELWLIRNDSHEIYQTPYNNTLSFEWPSYKVNGEHMKLILYEGDVHPPFQFDSEIFMSKIFSLYVNNLTEPMLEKLYKRNSFEEWIIYAGVFMVILFIVLLKYKSLLPLIDPLIKYIMQRFLTNQELDVDGRGSSEGVYNTSEL